MLDDEKLKQAFNKLNDEQKHAVTTLDGPVLVIAGPGTGKTQLLSLRVAHILEERDVSPHNILCLTFTNAGADAMRERLASFIGKDAYGVKIETFHSFAQSLRADYSEYFERGEFDKAISPLQATDVINNLLSELPVTSPLYQPPFDGVSGKLKDVVSLIGKIRKSGLSPEELLALCEQNEAFFSYIKEEKPQLFEMLSLELTMGKEAKIAALDELKSQLLMLLEAVPQALVRKLPGPLGSYKPYALMLKDAVQETEFVDDRGRSTGFTSGIRDAFFKGKPLRFKERRTNASLAAAVKLYQKYREYLRAHAFYDFDDMIIDAYEALERNPDFASELQAQYQYILIDEFQDTNGAQMKIVENIIAGLERPNLLAVGDDDQAIMRFQGASVEFINQFEHTYQDTTSIILKKNYRSVPAIVEFGQQLAKQIEKRLETSKENKHLEAARDSLSGLCISTQSYVSKELQYYEVAREISELIKNGYMQHYPNDGAEIAIIARTHGALKAMIPYLEECGVDFNYRVKRDVSHIESLQTLFALMRFVSALSKGSQERAEAELPLIIAAPEFELGHETCLQLAKEARLCRSWLSAVEKSSHTKVQDIYQNLVNLSAQAATMPVRELIYTLSKDIVSYYDARKEEDPYLVLEFNYGLKALLSFAQGELDIRTPRRSDSFEVQGPLRLPKLMELLEQSKRYGVEVSAELPIASKQAITLTTAHGSKGLEYNLVYLLDASSDCWKQQGRGSQLTPQNIFLSEAEDSDDARRLLFVAATRARNELRIRLAGTSIAPELLEITQPEPVESTLPVVEAVAPLSWKDTYYPQKANLKAVASELLGTRKLSASFLNAFVEYKNNSLDGQSFFAEKLLSFPQAPALSTDFGNTLHEFMAAYLNEVVKARTKTPEQLEIEARDALGALDHPESDLEHLNQRFTLFLEHFMPSFIPRLTTHAYAEQKVDAVLGTVPLTGRIDLLVKDPEAQTITLYDYKSGKAKSPGQQGSAYVRQLQFYKLLIESAPEYEGYTVTGGADVFVEPDLTNNYALAEEDFQYINTNELTHLRLLIEAVWWRLEEGLLDTSNFLQSAQLADLKARSVYKSNSGSHKKGDPKEPSASEYQEAYEQWLIDSWHEQKER